MGTSPRGPRTLSVLHEKEQEETLGLRERREEVEHPAVERVIEVQDLLHVEVRCKKVQQERPPCPLVHPSTDGTVPERT